MLQQNKKPSQLLNDIINNNIFVNKYNEDREKGKLSPLYNPTAIFILDKLKKQQTTEKPKKITFSSYATKTLNDINNLLSLETDNLSKWAKTPNKRKKLKDITVKWYKVFNAHAKLRGLDHIDNPKKHVRDNFNDFVDFYRVYMYFLEREGF